MSDVPSSADVAMAADGSPWDICSANQEGSSPRPVLKAIFDYVGTYLVNYAGFGMVTDLRDDLYNSILRRSSAFFSKHTTGTLISTIVNDIEKVQSAMSSVMAEFLQQFFTFFFTAGVVILIGKQLGGNLHDIVQHRTWARQP